jgi:hypothetical protein
MQVELFLGDGVQSTSGVMYSFAQQGRTGSAQNSS